MAPAHSFYSLCFFFLCCLLGGCSSIPNTDTKVRDPIKLSQITTYAISGYREERLRGVVMSDSNRNQVEYAIEKALDKNGLELVEINDASVLVNYFVVGRNLSVLYDYNRAVRACYDCKSLSYHSSKRHDLGTLILDLVDPVTGMSIWRGIAPRTIVFTKSEYENIERANIAIEQLLSHLFDYDLAKHSNNPT